MTIKPTSETEIFQSAVNLPAEERGAFLDRACGDNGPLRCEIESLLNAYDPDGSFLQSPALAATLKQPKVNQALDEQPGSMIGPYKIREKIGEGGFGVVYVAEQEQPVRRKVALKVIKPGMDSREIVARFEAERQALALMDHPHIAKILDANTTDSGRPYFVMELVRGVLITDYCNAHKLPTKQRLELFIQVCHAVQHSHQKGVVHRDLKPSNVLVAPHDGVPVVKVIDFGVAKALGQQLTDKSIYTRFASMIGTPLYMSPEQAEINALDVDTRSDVYSLGVLLYELLTGTTPFDRKKLESAAFDEMRRIIREETPESPSARVTTLANESKVIAASHGVDSGNLAKIIRGDLDVWMPNHIHLFVQTPKPNLSKGMQYLLSGYANWYAKRHQRTGHLFQGRFNAELVEDESYFWTLSRYIHLNPVRGKRPLVAHPRDWNWSSYGGYCEKRKRQDWIAYEHVLAAWQGEMGGRQPDQAYRRFVESGIDQPLKSPLAEAIDGWLLGSEPFLATVKILMKQPFKLDQVPKAVALSSCNAVEVIDTVAEYYQTTAKGYQVRRSSANGRDLAAWLAHRRTTATLRDLATHFGLSHPDSVSNLIRRAERELAKSTRLRKDLREIEASIDKTVNRV